MDRFGCIVVQIHNLNPEVTLHSMLLALRPNKFEDSLFKRPPNSMDKLRERAKGYIQMEKLSKFRNEVRIARQKHNKWEGSMKTGLHKSDKRHKPDKYQPLPKGPSYERYTPLIAKRTIILEEAFNMEVPIKLTLPLPLKPRLDRTKY